MQQEIIATTGGSHSMRPVDTSGSGVAWSAIVGGAVGGAALSLILLALGSGFGLASISPWSNANPSLTAVTWVTGAWLVVTQWLASGVGGYITGRLRVGWSGLHTHEVFFRDTANGFLSWATGAVIIAAFLTSATAALVGGATQATATAASGAAQGATQAAATQSHAAGADPTGYMIDTMFRTDHANADSNTSQDPTAETRRILLTDLQRGDVAPADRTYLAQLVSSRTGIPQADAEKRVDEAIAQAKAAEAKARDAANAARKAAATLSIFTGLAMLIGAFIAAAAAALGGQHRDEARWDHHPAL